jgi:hypothetical protein
MLLNLFLDNVWLAIGLFALLYVMDYVFTLKAARMYQEGANRHFVFPGGIELNPYFKEDIAKLRRFSFRFFLMLFFVGGVLLITRSFDEPEVFAMVWGFFIWMQIANHFRHIRNLMVFHYARTSTAVSGQIQYQHWLSLRLSALDMFSFAGLFLVLFLFWGSWFVLGGVISCLSLALRHLIDSRKSRLSSQTEA